MMTYIPAVKPWAHQEEALKRLRTQRAFALLMAMRTGKTKVILDDFGRLESAGACQDLLVVAPAGVYTTWLQAIVDHVSPSLQKRLAVYCWKAEDAHDKPHNFLRNAEGRPRVLLINIEALSTVVRAQTLAHKFLAQRASMMVVDESTSIKGPSAARAKFCCNVLGPTAQYRRILSGLAYPQSPLDAFMQFNFLDPAIIGFRNFSSFQRRYAITELKKFNTSPVPVEVVTGYQNLDELAEKLAPFSYKIKLEDCYDLPPKMYSMREVELTPEQRKAYSEMKRYATTMIEEDQHITSTVVLTQLLRMHQILMGHCEDAEGNPVTIPENRTKALLELLAEYEGKGIIWVSYGKDIHNVGAVLAEEYGIHSVARFWGMNRKIRNDEEQRFLTDPRCRWMVATPQAGGRGRTWTNASLVVYFSNTYNLEYRLQSEERAQGVGKSQSVLYVDLIAKGTVDEKIIGALRNKIDLSTKLTRDTYQEWLI
jgi:SNF2 family DNA or RNA helicase